jgi:hypothetical protein
VIAERPFRPWRRRLRDWEALAWHLAVLMTPLVVDDAAMLAMMFC